MVRTAFAFAAAARKSSTVFKFSARRSTIPLASKATGTRSDLVFINFVQTEAATDLHRFARITDGILLNLCLICVHLWRMVEKFLLAFIPVFVAIDPLGLVAGFFGFGKSGASPKRPHPGFFWVFFGLFVSLRLFFFLGVVFFACGVSTSRFFVVG